MLRIFRINDPYRLILVFLIILAYKIPILFSDQLLTIPELKNLLIGEKLADGAILYAELWDVMAPFSAWFYMLLDMVFGKSLFAHQVISILLLLAQAGIFNFMVIRRKIFNENTYIPALFYAISGLFFFDVSSLSPELLGMTFILFSFDSLFSHLELRRKNDINLINLGIYIGIASMFYFPYFTYFISITLGLLLFTNTIRRRYLLMLFGSVFIFLMIWVYYFLIDSHDLFFKCLIQPLFELDYRNYFTVNSIFYIILIPGIYLVMSIVKTFQSHGFSNYQVRIQSLFFLFFIFQLVAWFLWSHKAGSSLMLFVPVFSFFYTHFFLLVKKKVWRTVYLYVLTGAVILVFLVPFAGINFMKDKISLDQLLVDHNKTISGEGQKVWVIGEDLSYYHENKLATPYLSWSISKSLLLNINDYQNIITVYEAFQKEAPDVIIDEKNVFPEIMKRIPGIRNSYVKKNTYRYEKINN